MVESSTRDHNDNDELQKETFGAKPVVTPKNDFFFNELKVSVAIKL